MLCSNCGKTNQQTGTNSNQNTTKLCTPCWQKKELGQLQPSHIQLTTKSKQL